MMPGEFTHEVFLSHSSKDKAVARPLAERSRAEGLRVWFDEWKIKPGDSIPAKIDEGLDHSRVLVLCMSANAFGSDWAQLEAGTFQFRDPLNKERRLADLFTRVLISGTNHLLKRGFDRGYVSHHEWTGRIRGRICFQEAIRQNATRTGRLPCDFDEFSYDVLHNQILKATMRRLIRSEGLDAKNAEALAQLCRLFSDIRDIELTHRVFGQVQLHRNNEFYDFLLKVCELIYDNLLVSEKPGTSKFIDFIQDEAKMRILFEKFVRNFYHTHTHFVVSGEHIQWLWRSTNQASKELLPRMQTDISMTSDTRKLIIDCKFTPQATQQHHEAEKLRSSHLYQINAYMNNLEGEFAESCEMMLLYPAIGPASASLLPAAYIHKGHKIRICTINLNQPWQGIHNDLLKLIE